MSLPFAAWGAAPYLLLWLVGRGAANQWPGIGAGVCALAVELGVRASVFVWPRGSTAAIALVFSPVFIAAIVMPAGAVLGWGMSHLWRSHAAGRAAVVVTAPRLIVVTAADGSQTLFVMTEGRIRAIRPRAT